MFNVQLGSLDEAAIKKPYIIVADSHLGIWDGHVYTAICKIDNQRGPTTQHRELCLILCINLNGERTWTTDSCMCISESLCYIPEINTTLLINIVMLLYKIKIKKNRHLWSFHNEILVFFQLSQWYQ